MDNYKIKVKDEAESKEAQELFFELGFQWHKEEKGVFWETTSGFIFANGNTKILFGGVFGDADTYTPITIPQLRDLVAQSKLKAQGLISGADVPALLKNGQLVQCRVPPNGSFNGGEWKDINLETDEEEFTLGDFINSRYEWRLKPQTIKLDLEIPAPCKVKIGGRDDTSFVLNVGRHQYLYQNEDDYTKARNALEAVFDAALGGNNS
ncbi:hypothetical protein OLN43_14420 [Acinetobacter baumannii]|uniref:hypothetical protein n=1 Tax=Acinetobacter baumannii TaxID=470 RepID=UPI0022213222|nr:hypothetical protein [Acinetobacter baumannii]MCW1490447.1 hypothetical protein [Acinetobacter baumannii]